jgi:hypothetical protein
VLGPDENIKNIQMGHFVRAIQKVMIFN